jgi:mRNA interferase MazF
MFMPNFSKNEIILVSYPYSDFSDSKVRPAVITSENTRSNDVFIVPLTSNTRVRRKGEFILKNWKSEGLNRPTAVKRGIYTVSKNMVIQSVGILSKSDAKRLESSIRIWFGLNQKQ